MTELSALNVRITGDAGDLKAAVGVATGELGKVHAAAQKAQAGTSRLVGGLDATSSSAARSGHALRGVAQQLSQVGQQTMATGNFIQALAIQLPDIGLAFGAVGTAAGLLAGIALPMVAAAFMGAGAESDALKAKQEALKGALDDVTTATERYRLERAMGESGAQTMSEQVLLNEINAILSERRGIEAEIVALSYDEAEATSLANSAELGRLAARRQAIDARKAELDAALAALNAERETNAQLERKKAALAAAHQTYARTRAEGEKLAEAAARAGLSASDLSHVNFSNISGAATEALRLAGNLGIALDTASKLAALGPQGIGGNDPSGQTYSGRGRGPTAGELAEMRAAAQSGGYRTISVAGADGGAGAGAGGGANPLQAELEALQQSLVSQEQLEAESYARRMEMLQQALDQRLITQQEYARLMEQVESTHQAAMGAETRAGVSATLSALGSLFEGSKKIGAGIALANSWLAFTEVLKDPALVGRPWARFAAATQALAGGLNAVRNIKGAQVGGSGAGGGAMGGAPQGGMGPLQVSLNTFGGGDFIKSADFGMILDKLNQEAGDRGYTILSAPA